MILYKYYPCNDKTFDALKKRYLWLHTSQETNDDNECFWCGISATNTNDQGVYDELRKEMAFGALSKNRENNQMWDRYGDNHKGIVVEFEIGIELINSGIFKKVLYYPSDKVEIENRQKLNYREIIYYHGLGLKNNDQQMLNKYSSIVLEALSVKTDEWKYEEEFRIWTNRHRYQNQPTKGIEFEYNPAFKLIRIFLGKNFDFDKHYRQLAYVISEDKILK